MKASVCIATYDKPDYLLYTLTSIYSQKIMRLSSEVEVIVVDDRSPDRNNFQICQSFPVCYVRLDGPPGYRNPAVARNVAYRLARGKIVIPESDDTVHASRNCIAHLIEELHPGTFVIATVYNTDFSGCVVPGNLENPTYNALTVYTGKDNQRPLFFLGSLYRKDLYAVGGNDEEFVAPSYEDNWFADCLMRGLGLSPVYSTTIIGHHLQHRHLGDDQAVEPSRRLYSKKINAANQGVLPWCASGGPWDYREQ